MTTPPCYGAEFTTNADHCLTTTGVPTKTWPYAATCDLANTNGLRRDPDQGLWTRPRTPHLFNFNARSPGVSQINTAGIQSWSWQQPLTADPASCNSEQLDLTVTFALTVELYANTWTTLLVWAGQANPVPAASTWEPVDTKWFWDQTSPQPQTLNGLVTKRIALSGTAAQIGIGMAVNMQQKSGSTPTWGRILDYAVDSVGWIYPMMSPASDG